MMVIDRSELRLRCGLGHVGSYSGGGMTSAPGPSMYSVGDEDVEGSEPYLLASAMVSKGIVHLEYGNGKELVSARHLLCDSPKRRESKPAQ